MNTASIAIVVWYGAANIVSFATFVWDKRRAATAIRGADRVPERRLHLLSAIGGCAGSVAAMYLFRHKTRKSAFVAITFLCVAAHSALWIWMLIR